MIHDLKPYASYKDSGVPSLGSIPEHWQVMRNKLFLEEKNDRSEDGSEELLTVSQYTGVTRRRERLSAVGELLTNAASLIGYKRVMPGDLVMNIMLAWNGSLGVSSIEGIASPAYCVFRVKKKMDSRFLHYLFRTSLFTGMFKTVSTGVVDSRLRLYPDVFFRLSSVLPPLVEQSAIVRFLDHADRRIRRYIRGKKKLIALLNEQKQAIIHRAVTRGLDPGVRLKPSGVEWLGEVPEHWEVVRLRWYISIGSGDFIEAEKAGNEATADKPYPVIGGNGVMGYSAAYNSDKATVVIGRVGALCGNVHLIDTPAWITDNALRITSIKDFIPAYLATQMRAMNLNRLANANAQPLVTGGMIKSQRVVKPPITEQHRLGRQLEEILAPIESTAIKAYREIDLLTEYRTRLITDVVTGKLDVLEAAARLPEEAEEVEALMEDDDESDGDLDSAPEEAEV